MFGRRPRTKTPEQIGRELDLLRKRSLHSVFFVADNFIGNKKEAKHLLRYLIDYQRRHAYSFAFSTEASLNLAGDEEMLQLLREANFGCVFIGIESPEVVSLEETNKSQNLRQDMLTAVRTIYSHGMDVLAGFIVGFDNDTPETFDRQYRFITESGIQVAMVGLLIALPHTPLYQRLERAGRLLPQGMRGDDTKPATNVLPKRMEYKDMVERYETLFRHLLRPAAVPPLSLSALSRKCVTCAGRCPWLNSLAGNRRSFSNGCCCKVSCPAGHCDVCVSCTLWLPPPVQPGHRSSRIELPGCPSVITCAAPLVRIRIRCNGGWTSLRTG